MLNRAGKSLGDFKAVAASFAVAGVAAFAAAAGAAAAFTKEAINTADEMGRMAQKGGIAVETFSALAHAAALSDVSNETLLKGLKGLSTELVGSGRGTADLTQELLSIAGEFENTADGAAKTALAVQHFGKAGQDMIPLLNQGSDAIRAQMEEAQRFGLVISSGFAANADEFNDNLGRIKDLFHGLWLQVAEKVLPTFNALLEMFVDFVSNKEVMTGTVELISLGFETLGKTVLAVAEAFMVVQGIFRDETWAEMGAKMLALEERFDGVREKFANLSLGNKDKPAPELIDPADVDKALTLLDQLKQERLRGLAQVSGAEDLKFQADLDRINKLKIAQEDKDQLIEAAALAHEQRLTDIGQQGLAIRAEMDDAYSRGQIDRYIALQTDINTIQLGTLEGQQNMMKVFSELWTTSLLNVKGAFLSFAANVTTTFSQGFGNAVASIVTGAQSASAAFKALGTQILGMLVSFITRLVLNTVIAKALQSTIAATTIASIVPISSAWGVAAAAAAIATLGGATAGAAGVIPVLAATGAAAGGLSLAFGSGGIAHGGLDYVPREGTYLLNKGEMVPDPGTSDNLRRMADHYASTGGGGGGGSRPTVVEFHLDGNLLARAIGEMSRDGRLVLDGRSIT